MNITIYGAGYVGLVTGICFATMGHHVCCLDVDAAKIDHLKQGILPIYEENLDQLLHENLIAQRIFFTTDIHTAVKHANVQIIAVGTPQLKNGAADLQYVDTIAQQIGQTTPHDLCVVNKSTVPVGTASRVEKIIRQEIAARGVNTHCDVVSNPEFLREGQAVSDCLAPDRIVIGTQVERAIEQMRELYLPLTEKGHPLLIMDTPSAELTKYAANAFLATKISFMNEMSQIAERVGANIHHIKKGLSLDSRINPAFLNAGCGFGGSCFPKDVSALQFIAKENHYEPQILNAVLKTNEQQQKLLFYKINAYFNNDLKDKTIALWGLAFKPNTDDIRCASSRVLLEMLLDVGAYIRAYDPLASNHIRQHYHPNHQLILCDSKDDTLHNADALAVVTEWDHFKSPNFQHVKNTLKSPVIFDGRNMYDADLVRQMGLVYFGIGVN